METRARTDLDRSCDRLERYVRSTPECGHLPVHSHRYAQSWFSERTTVAEERKRIEGEKVVLDDREYENTDFVKCTTQQNAQQIQQIGDLISAQQGALDLLIQDQDNQPAYPP